MLFFGGGGLREIGDLDVRFTSKRHDFYKKLNMFNFVNV
jgi:hypothetical protein